MSYASSTSIRKQALKNKNNVYDTCVVDCWGKASPPLPTNYTNSFWLKVIALLVNCVLKNLLIEWQWYLFHSCGRFVVHQQRRSHFYITYINLGNKLKS